MSMNANNTTAATSAPASVDPHMPPVISDVAAPTTQHHNNSQPHRQHKAQLAGHHAALSSIFSNFLDNLSSNLPPPSTTSSASSSTNTTTVSPRVVQPPGKNMRRTSDLLETLQQALAAPPPKLANLQLPQRSLHHHRQQQQPSAHANLANGATAANDAPVVSRVVEKDVPCFSALVEIIAATGIVRTFVGQQKSADDLPPSSYVTFEARGHEQPPFADDRVIESPDGAVYATAVVATNACPEWRQRFEAVQLPIELLSNPSKRFVIKVWCKTHSTLAGGQPVATPNADSLVGYAVVNLSELPAETASICDWFNVADVFGRVNGRLQLRIGVSDAAVVAAHCLTTAERMSACCAGQDHLVAEHSAVLNQTIKRKFTELEDITKRLKARLGDVTDDAHFENILDEFENDLNTMPDEMAETDEFDWLMVAGDSHGDDHGGAERLRGDSADGPSGGASDECNNLSQQLLETSLDRHTE